MSNAKVCLFAAIIGVAVGGTGVLIATSTSAAAPQEGKDQWRNHDGRWSHWNAADKSWYYTDGKHWFVNRDDKAGWKLYRFDGKFGMDFERGKYELPGVNIKLDLPTHEVWRR